MSEAPNANGEAAESDPWAWLRPRSAGLALAAAVWSFGLVAAALVIPREFGLLAPLWLANAATLAVLLRIDSGRWPPVMAMAMLGNIVAALVFRDGPWAATALAACNMFEIATCAVVLRRWCDGRVDFARWAHVKILLLTAPAASAASALLASMSLGLLGLGDFLTNFTLWALADTLGLLILTPALLAVVEARSDLAERPFIRQSWLALAVFAAVCAAVFIQDRYPLLFLIPPALVLVARETERPGTALALLLLAVTSVATTLAGFRK